MTSESKCPVTGGTRTHTNRDWWPSQLSLQVLHQHSTLSNPMGEAFDYAKEFKSLDLNAVIKDLHALMTDLRFALVASGAWRGLRVRRLAGEVRDGFCGGVGQGDGRFD